MREVRKVANTSFCDVEVSQLRMTIREASIDLISKCVAKIFYKNAFIGKSPNFFSITENLQSLYACFSKKKVVRCEGRLF